MLLYTLIGDYLQALRVEQGAAATTQKGYTAQIRHFHTWLTANGYPEPILADFNAPVCRRFLYYLSGKGLRPRSIRSYFHPLKGFGEFLIRNGVLTDNPAKTVTLPKKDAALRKTITDEEIALLLDACRRHRSPRRVALCRAVLCVLVYGALRRSELCDLRLEDVTLPDPKDKKSKGSLLVRCGKGSKSRRIYLPDEALAALKEWLALRPLHCKHRYLFVYDVNRRLGHTSLQMLVEDLKFAAGLAGHDNIKPHSIRHWRATDLLRSGANIRDVQAFLGHSSLTVTAIYCHSSEEQLRNISELTNLRNQTPDAPTEPQRKADRRNGLRLPAVQPERSRLRRIGR